MKHRTFSYFTTWLALLNFSFIFFVSSTEAIRTKNRLETTTINSSEEEFIMQRTYRPILHFNSTKKVDREAPATLARIADDCDKISRAGCPIGNPNANEVISTIPGLIIIAAIIIGIVWFFIFLALYESFSEGAGALRSYSGESIGDLITNAANLVYTPEFNRISDFILNSISKLY